MGDGTHGKNHPRKRNFGLLLECENVTCGMELEDRVQNLQISDSTGELASKSSIDRSMNEVFQAFHHRR